MVDVFHVARIHLHLAAEHRLERLGHVVPRRNFLVARGELAVRRDDAELLLPGERFLAQLVPAGIELALVLVSPSLRDVMWCVRRAGREIDEDWLVRAQGLLLTDPANGLVGHVLHEVVTLFGCLLGLDRRRPLIQRWVPLVRLAADESIEVFEASAAGGPGVERTNRAGLPHGHFV